jgi:hypothetical protein
MAQKNLKRRRASVKKKPDLPEVDLKGIGMELRSIAKRLKLVESCMIVINMALDGQDVEQDNEISTLLKHLLNHLFFEPIRDLENVATKCDGEPPSDRNTDDDEDEGGAS